MLYPAEDSLRKEMALAAASDVAKLGIDAPVEGTTFEIMLDAPTAAAVVAVIRDYQQCSAGGVPAISHDAGLLDRWADRTVHLP